MTLSERCFDNSLEADEKNAIDGRASAGAGEADSNQTRRIMNEKTPSKTTRRAAPRGKTTGNTGRGRASAANMESEESPRAPRERRQAPRRQSARPLKSDRRRSGGGGKKGGGGSGSKGSGGGSRRALYFALARLFGAFAIIGGIALVYLASQLPDIGALNTIKKQQGITVETVDGHVLANYGDVYGQYVPYDQIPKTLVQAVMATEDRRFFEHHGVDFFGIARAMVTNLVRGHMVQGGSTVTQQVAKNVFLTPERTLKRKLQEVMLAFWLEARFSKKEIMAIYLNRVYLGAGTFGVDAAAHRYFSKSASELNLQESALLAGLLKAPSRYSPASNSEKAQGRLHQVLLNMVDAGYLKQKEADAALATYVKSPSHAGNGGDVRYFTDWIVDTLPETIGQVDQDLIVTTTLDPKLQALAQDTLQNVISTEGPKKNISQGALVSMRPDGAVVAMVGGTSYAESQYNRATQAHRQPGSVFKLFVYLSALEAGLTPLSTVEDAPITLQVGNKSWSPDNFENKGYRGEIPMVEAIRYSLNTVSVRLSQYAGVSRVADMAMRLGVPNIPSHPSIALGAVEATLLEMTGAYAHLPNQGMPVVPYGVVKVRTRAGKEIFQHEAPEGGAALAKGAVEMMNYMLMDVATRGTGSKAALPGRQVAGKTGTSQDYKDAWFIGFVPQLVTGVWVGNDDNKSMKRVTGGSVPTTIWHDYMLHALEGVPVAAIPNSSGSSEGLLPWLFGGSNGQGQGAAVSGAAPTPGGEPAADEPAAAGSAPASSPFRHVGDPDPSPPATAPASAPTAPAAAPVSAPAPLKEEKSGGDSLGPEFWHKLQEKVPSKEKLEYNYPTGKRH